jgi:hypothetical protein
MSVEDVRMALEETLAELSKTAERVARFERRLSSEQRSRQGLVRKAAEEGANQAVIAKVSGLTVERVRQILARDPEA